LGNFDVDEASRIIESLFAKEKPKELIKREINHSFKRPENLFKLFQHDLITQVEIQFFYVIPSRSFKTFEDFYRMCIDDILASVWESRISKLIQDTSSQALSSLSWETDDSYEENCCVQSLNFKTDTKNWREALKLGMIEVKRMYEFGITENEMKL